MILLQLLACTPTLPIPAGLETLAGFDQPDACGDLNFVIDSANPQDDGTDIGGILSVHVGGDPLANLAKTLLAPGATEQVQLDPNEYPLTMSWIEGGGRRNESVCPSSGLPGSNGSSVTYSGVSGDSYVILLPTTVDPAAVSDNCDVVTAIALVTGGQATFRSADGEERAVLSDVELQIRDGYTTIGVPVPCRW